LVREAFIDGFRDQVHSRYDEGEERFPGSEHSRAQEKKRESFCQSFSAHVAQKVADLPAKEKTLHRIVREANELRAKDPSKTHLRVQIAAT
jgi:hypothetical protein